MKTLKEILEALVFDIESTLNKDINFSNLVKAKSYKEYLEITKILKSIIEDSGNSIRSSRELKKENHISSFGIKIILKIA